MQRNSKLVILGNWYACPHTPKMIKAIWRNLWRLSAGKRSSSPFKFSLRYYKDIVNLFWVLWACLVRQTQLGKLNFTPYSFVEILQRYANFWVLWACLVAHIQNDSINLYRTLMFICMQKINFIIHFILEILHFKQSCNLIGCSNLRTRIFPDMRLVVKYQQQY